VVVEVMVERALNRALVFNQTIYYPKNIFQEFKVLRDYVKKTGIDVKNIVVFTPKRTLLHFAISAVIIALPIKEEQKKFEIVQKICNSIENNPVFKVLDSIKEMKKKVQV